MSRLNQLLEKYGMNIAIFRARYFSGATQYYALVGSLGYIEMMQDALLGGDMLYESADINGVMQEWFPGETGTTPTEALQNLALKLTAMSAFNEVEELLPNLICDLVAIEPNEEPKSFREFFSTRRPDWF